MKKCPVCNRTYADETLTYCLADGSLLSAPYDPNATLIISPRDTDPPPTEVLPSNQAPTPPLTKNRKAVFAYIIVGILALITGIGIMAWLKSRDKDTLSNDAPISNSPVVTNTSSTSTSNVATKVGNSVPESENRRRDSSAVLPQAVPVRTLLNAVRLSDTQLLQTAFSPAMVKSFEKDGLTWEEVLNVYTNIYRKEFGDYKIDDFVYSFQADPVVSDKVTDERGKVTIIFKGEEHGGLRVIREVGSVQWKLNER
ncbi:MAG TPA: hypothetical protein VFQ47_04740 [Nitrososphaera sp.]|nr:hypothetical protein [Nitrososphaera sp.]